MPIEKVNDRLYRVRLGDDIVEIGDEKESEFKPILKLTRWNGEAHVKFRFKDDGIAIKTTTLETDRLKWETPLLDIHFSELPPTSLFEGGGIDQTIVLKQRPPVSSIPFPIEMKGLKAYYQPPLTEEFKQEDCEIWTPTHVKTKDGMECFRPEPIVGSYAFYHESKRNNEYKAGKAFHKPRPRAIDADGDMIWGTLDFDEISGLLTYSFDPVWLDNAVYPVRIGTEYVHTYYYTAYDSGEAWETTPQNMVDNVLTNYAVTNNSNEVERLTAHNGAPFGGITKVEIRAYGYTAVDEKIYLRPVFSAGDGDNHEWVLPTSPDWSPWYDITNDTNAPSPWTGTDFVNLDVDIQYVSVGGKSNNYVSKVEVRVTETNSTFGKTDVGGSDGNISPNQLAGCKQTAPEAGDITKLTAYLKVDSGSSGVKGVLYDDSSGSPTNVKAQSGETTVDATWGWDDFTLSYSMSNGEILWLTTFHDLDGTIKYDAGAANQWDWNADGIYPTVPNPWGSHDQYGIEMSIYATYTAAGAGQQLLTLINLMEY